MAQSTLLQITTRCVLPLLVGLPAADAWASTEISIDPIWNGPVLVTLALALTLILVISVRSHRALQQERRQKELILDTTHDIILCFEADMRVSWANRAACISLGKTPEEICGEFCYELWHQRQQPCPNCPVVRCRESGQPEEGEVSTPDGRRFLIRGYPIQRQDGSISGVVEVVVDITDRVRAEQALMESEARYRSLVENSPVGIYRSTPGKGQYLHVNPALVRMYGFDSVDELLRVPVQWLYQNPEDREELLSTLTREGVVRDHEIAMRRKDGSLLWCSSYATAHYDPKGQIDYLEGILEDITQRKQAQDKLEEANRELESFAHTVSHDLKIPLTSILGFTDVLQDLAGEKLDGAEQECLVTIRQQGERMHALMEDLLTLAKIGQLDAPSEPTLLAGILHETLPQLEPGSFHAGIESQVPPNLSFPIPPTLLSQLFLNLIGNAQRYAPEASLPIEVGAEKNDRTLRLWVRDHGPGVPEEELETIFQAFYRGSTGRGTLGTGIGLATVMKIARRYEGHAWAEPTDGGGCTVFVELIYPTP